MPETIIHLDDLPETPGKSGWPWNSLQCKLCPQTETLCPVDQQNFPSIAIVTPSYNQGAFLEKTIRTVLAQQYPKLKYIVIDGGSTDNSVNILKKYDEFIDYWISESDNGQSCAINKGFNTPQANCDINMWLCSDDLLMPGALLAIGSYFSANPQCQWLSGAAAHMHIDSEDDAQIFPAGLTDRNALSDFWRLGEPGRFIKQSSVAWRRSLWEATGPLREDLHLAMDHDLWLRFNEISPMHAIDTLVSLAQLHDDCKSISSTEKQILETMRCCYNSYKRTGRSELALTLRMLIKLPTWRFGKIAKNLKKHWYGGILNELVSLPLDPIRVWTEAGRMKIIKSRPLF